MFDRAVQTVVLEAFPDAVGHALEVREQEDKKVDVELRIMFPGKMPASEYLPLCKALANTFRIIWRRYAFDGDFKALASFRVSAVSIALVDITDEKQT